MEAFKTEAEVSENGTLTLHGVPFSKGERVEVIVLRTHAAPPDTDDPYPLRGTVIKYDDPFEPAISPDEWEALR